MTTIINKNAGYTFVIEPVLTESFSGYEVRMYNLIGAEYVDTFFFREKDEAIEFSESVI